MYKKFLIYLAIVSPLIFVIATTINFTFFNTLHNRNFSRELNKAIIELLEEVIHVQYHTHSAETLEKIFTEELLQEYNNHIINFFSEESFYLVNRNYMRTLQSLDDNQWHVIVRIHEGKFMSEYSIFLHVGIIKTEEGSYLINSIGRDA